MQYTASVERSILSTPSTLTRIRSPRSDHASIHKCSSDTKFQNWPLSWLPSQLFSIRSLILYGLAISAGLAESLCMALEMLQIASNPPNCCGHFFTNSPQGVCNLLSDLLLKRHQLCCGGHTCLLLRCAAAAAADLEGLQQAPLAMALFSAPLPCQMELCFVTRLSQREFVGRVLSVHDSSVTRRTNCAKV